MLEPLKLRTGNTYNLNNLKEIEVTDEFLNLDQNIRMCQNGESLQNCQTRKYIDELVKKCKCLPFAISHANEVNLKSNSI